MAIPAVRIWLSAWIPTSKLSVQPLNIRPSQDLLVQCPIPEYSRPPHGAHLLEQSTSRRSTYMALAKNRAMSCVV